jgi:uncharacterized membrane protein YgcG
MDMIKPLFAALLVLPLVTGCDGARRTVVSPGFGAALNYDLAIQVDNPERHPAEEVAPDLDGKVAVDAWERYRSHTVIRPRAATTSTLGNVGGGGGGGGGGSSGGTGTGG